MTSFILILSLCAGDPLLQKEVDCREVFSTEYFSQEECLETGVNISTLLNKKPDEWVKIVCEKTER